VTADVAMDALLHQNFTRDRHSADILHCIAETLRDRPAYRLTYSDLDEAVECLEQHFRDWPDASPMPPSETGRPFRMADFEMHPVLSSIKMPHRQRAGCLTLTIGDKLYLADPEGKAIHRTDPLSAAIWALLAEPISAADILDLLVEEFPDADRDRIDADLGALLARLRDNGLISA
ncbi:MAG TPA: PqqD family protein, partial [Tabrizicola sp.]|nr:PqqD family protein [Tabrizicola sp.]